MKIEDKTAEQLRAIPCPFCDSSNISDGEVLIETPDGRTAKQSECQDCGALGPYAFVDGPDYGDVLAIKAWNTRADSGEAVDVEWEPLPEDSRERSMFDSGAKTFRMSNHEFLLYQMRIIWMQEPTNGSYKKQLAIMANEIAKLFTHPRATAVDVRDAERYRYLRKSAVAEWRNGPGLYWCLPRHMLGNSEEKLDQHIDAQLAAIASREGEGK